MQFYLVAFIVSIGFTLVHPNNEMDKNPSKVQEDFVHLFDSIQNNRAVKTLTYRSALEQEAARERAAFDTIKEDMRLTRQKKNSYRKSGDTSEKVAPFKREIVRGDQAKYYEDQYPNEETHVHDGGNTSPDWIGTDGMVNYNSENVTPDDTVPHKCETSSEATESSSASTTVDEDSIVVAKSSLTEASTCVTPTSADEVKTQTNGTQTNVCTKRIDFLWLTKLTIPVQQSYFHKRTCEIMYCTPNLKFENFACKSLYTMLVPPEGIEDLVNKWKVDCASEQKCVPAK